MLMEAIMFSRARQKKFGFQESGHVCNFQYPRHLPTLILTCLWMSGLVLTKALP